MINTATSNSNKNCKKLTRDNFTAKIYKMPAF